MKKRRGEKRRKEEESQTKNQELENKLLSTQNELQNAQKEIQDLNLSIEATEEEYEKEKRKEEESQMKTQELEKKLLSTRKELQIAQTEIQDLNLSIQATKEDFEKEQHRAEKHEISGRILREKWKMSDPSHPVVFLYISIGGILTGGIIIELFAHESPHSAENFRALCIGCKYVGNGEKLFHFKGSTFFYLGSASYCGGGIKESIYDSNFRRDAISPEVLDLTEDDLIEKFTSGVSMVTALAISYPTLAAAPHMFINAYKNVLAIAVATDYSFPRADKVKEYLEDLSKFAVAAAAEDDLIEKFASGVSMFTALALVISYPTLAAAPHMFINAYKNVLAIAVATDYSFPWADKVKEYLEDPSKFSVAAAPAAAKVEEPAEESDDDIGFSLFVD